VAAFVAMAALVASIAATDGDSARRPAAKLRFDPDSRARLIRLYREFQDLPRDEQERIRQLDRSLHEEDSATQARLFRIMEAYTGWLTRLNAFDQARVLRATSNSDRLAVIREIRDRQWRERLPQAQALNLRSASPEQYTKLADDIRRQQLQRNQEWQGARLAWDVETVFNRDPIDELRRFVNTRLRPMLTPAELRQLNDLENSLDVPRLRMQWFFLVHELSGRHPVLSLNPLPRQLIEAPKEYQQAFAKINAQDQEAFRKRATLGTTPQFAIELTEFLRTSGVAPKEQLGPCRSNDLPEMTRKVVESLMRKSELTRDERESVRLAEGRWPDYMRAILQVARVHRVYLPEFSVPFDPRKWDAMKQRFPTVRRLPEPPEPMFREFVMKYVNEHDGSSWRLSPTNPVDREKLKELFYEQNKDVLEKQQSLDREKMQKKMLKGKK
jgi:hypothetical protein